MIVLSRFRVPDPEQRRFRDQAEAAVAVLAARDGFRSADLGRNLDDPGLWTLTTRWADVGSYRRALQGYEAKARGGADALLGHRRAVRVRASRPGGGEPGQGHRLSTD